MPIPAQLHDFLRHAHIFASTVREVFEEKCLRESTDLDLSFPQLTLVQLISNNGDHQVNDIANFFGVSAPAASKMVDKLVRLGLIKRTLRKDDRRAVSLSVTPEGRSLIRRYASLKETRAKQLCTGLPEEQLEQLTRGLERSSYLILKQEGSKLGELCLKCSALYSPDCILQELLHDACLYSRKRSHGRR